MSTADGCARVGESGLLDESGEELYEDAPCGYLSTAPDGTILKANRTFLAMAGYESGQLEGRLRFYDLLPPGAKIYYETHYAPLLSLQHEVREIALELVRPDGARLPVLVNARLKLDDAGSPLLVRMTVFDASDRRRYERELLSARVDAEVRAAAASALDHVTEGVVLVDDDGTVGVANVAAGRLLGRSAEELIGTSLAGAVPGWETVRARIPVASSGARATSVVVPLAVGGETRWVAASGELAPGGIVYTLRDVTEARRLDEVRDDIVAIVSHELRTPLAGVYGAAQTLAARGDELSDDQRAELIGMIIEQSGRLSRIVEEILLTQRLDSGDLAPERTSFDVTALVARVLEKTHSWRNARPVSLAGAVAVEADADPELFEQVLVNLLDNAMKYSPPGTEVVVRVERQRASVRVSVADQGPGIEAADRERIFERFFRVDPTQVTGVPGTGLGLYITRELVHRMNGRVGLLPSDRGATFFVDLPAVGDGGVAPPTGR